MSRLAELQKTGQLFPELDRVRTEACQEGGGEVWWCQPDQWTPEQLERVRELPGDFCSPDSAQSGARFCEAVKKEYDFDPCYGLASNWAQSTIAGLDEKRGSAAGQFIESFNHYQSFLLGQHFKGNEEQRNDFMRQMSYLKRAIIASVSDIKIPYAVSQKALETLARRFEMAASSRQILSLENLLSEGPETLRNEIGGRLQRRHESLLKGTLPDRSQGWLDERHQKKFEKRLKKFFGEGEMTDPDLWRYPRLAVEAVQDYHDHIPMSDKVEEREPAAVFLTELSRDRDYAISLVQVDGRLLRHLPENFMGDPEIVLVAVRQNGFALYHASPSLQKSDRYPEIALAAVEEEGRAFESVHGVEHQWNGPVYRVALQQVFGASRLADPNAWKDPTLLNELFGSNDASVWWNYYMFARESFDDREIGLALVSINGKLLVFLSKESRKDPEVLLTAVHQNGHAVGYAGYRAATFQIALAAVQEDGLAYTHLLWQSHLSKFRNTLKQAALVQVFGAESPYARLETWRDPVAVAAALRENKDYTLFLEEGALDNRDFAFAVTRHNGEVFELLKDDFKKEPDFILAGATEVNNIFEKVNPNQLDPEFLAEVFAVNSRIFLWQYGLDSHPVTKDRSCPPSEHVLTRETIEKVFPIGMARLAERGVVFPEGMSHRVEDFLAGLKKEPYGIHHPVRFRSLANLQEVVQNRNPDPSDKREVAFVSFSVADNNGMLDMIDVVDDFLEDENFRVVYHEIETVEQEVALLDHYTE
ncbi:MAG: DUF4116 domain-containing protein, partial [bacterium]|nr:DUF4116 domain-containing protein [bacterium]